MGSDDNFPTVIGRPVFDTEPCPAPAKSIHEARRELDQTCTELRAARLRLEAAYPNIAQWHPDSDFTGKDEAGNPVRVSAKSPAEFEWIPQVPADDSARFRFPGGPVTIPEPTREALIESVIDWAHAVKCHVDSIYMDALAGKVFALPAKEARSALDRLDAVLAELAAMEAK